MPEKKMNWGTLILGIIIGAAVVGIIWMASKPAATEGQTAQGGAYGFWVPGAGFCELNDPTCPGTCYLFIPGEVRNDCVGLEAPVGYSCRQIPGEMPQSSCNSIGGPERERPTR